MLSALLFAAFAPLSAAGELYVIIESAKLYSAPDPASKLVVELPKDTELVLYRQRVKWVHVIAGDYSGWIKTCDISDKKGGDPLGRTSHEKVKPSKRGVSQPSGGGEDSYVDAEARPAEGGDAPSFDEGPQPPAGPEQSEQPQDSDRPERRPGGGIRSMGGSVDENNSQDQGQ